MYFDVVTVNSGQRKKWVNRQTTHKADLNHSGRLHTCVANDVFHKAEDATIHNEKHTPLFHPRCLPPNKRAQCDNSRAPDTQSVYRVITVVAEKLLLDVSHMFLMQPT